MQLRSNNLKEMILHCRKALKNYGDVVETNMWQGRADVPPFLEILNLNAIAPMVDSLDALQELTEAVQPWAATHFEERVCGKPLNPPPSHNQWLKRTDEYLSSEKFSHSYPERLWPKSLIPDGIRFKTADLYDAAELLKKDPTTRQCYVPMYFPEDLTAANQGERVPCTLGWHFIIRNNKMHCLYPMRSCDALRHFHNDIYFANRLALWIAEQSDLDVQMGNISFSCTSFHCFENDMYMLKQSVGE